MYGGLSKRFTTREMYSYLYGHKRFVVAAVVVVVDDVIVVVAVSVVYVVVVVVGVVDVRP